MSQQPSRLITYSVTAKQASARSTSSPASVIVDSRPPQIPTIVIRPSVIEHQQTIISEQKKNNNNKGKIITFSSFKQPKVTTPAISYSSSTSLTLSVKNKQIISQSKDDMQVDSLISRTLPLNGSVLPINPKENIYQTTDMEIWDDDSYTSDIVKTHINKSDLYAAQLTVLGNDNLQQTHAALE
ncbi:hypothetical protein RclHR1_24840001 [Rhizophagus clarus]|uniref:Uncharacterized protein n=1 Tax=Rhizophagus clarus TaxID=94130 RepID=A0A2Z6QZR0_9GLOM|nr:hypothetical protein RclHR1_24840001 [Rhizophagus clarus]GES78997.1 hypothetical protein RCL_jg6025.t1 [Rhizophagus clarus]